MLKISLAVASVVSLAFVAPAYARYEAGPVTIASLTTPAPAAVDFPIAVDVNALVGLSRDEVQLRVYVLSEAELDVLKRQIWDGQLRHRFIPADH